jgi:hypothetical protein
MGLPPARPAIYLTSAVLKKLIDRFDATRMVAQFGRIVGVELRSQSTRRGDSTGRQLG